MLTGKVIQYNARLIAQGYTQVYGQDFDEVFAPVANQMPRPLNRFSPGIEAVGTKTACLL